MDGEFSKDTTPKDMLKIIWGLAAKLNIKKGTFCKSYISKRMILNDIQESYRIKDRLNYLYKRGSFIRITIFQIIMCFGVFALQNTNFLSGMEGMDAYLCKVGKSK